MPVIYNCNVCGLPQGEGRRLINVPGLFICSECVDLFHAILHRNDQPTEPLGDATEQPPEPLGDVTEG